MSKKQKERLLTEQELYDLHTEHIEACGHIADLYYQARHVDHNNQRAEGLHTYSQLIRQQYHDFLSDQALLRQRAARG